jgi:HSP20 family protein
MPKRHGEEWFLTISPIVPSMEVGVPQIARQRGWMPRIDLLESEAEVLIRAELAGVDPQSVAIHALEARGAIVLRGERTDDLAQRGQNYRPHLLEIEEGPFQREIGLPEGEYDYKSIRAHAKCGVLSIYVPKRPRSTTVVIVESVSRREP